MRSGERVFVDSGAWIALALARDSLHEHAKAAWETIGSAGARLYTSIPVVLETFIFLDRNASREVALVWKDSLAQITALEILDCPKQLMEAAWSFFDRNDLHKLSAVDATSFALMKEERIRVAFTFDHHFAVVGFRLVG